MLAALSSRCGQDAQDLAGLEGEVATHAVAPALAFACCMVLPTYVYCKATARITHDRRGSTSSLVRLERSLAARYLLARDGWTVPRTRRERRRKRDWPLAPARGVSA